MKRKDHKTLYINGIKFIALGNIVKKRKSISYKNWCSRSINRNRLLNIRTIFIDDVTSFSVRYKTICISNIEECEFEILN